MWAFERWVGTVKLGSNPEINNIEYGFRQCKKELGWTDYRLGGDQMYL